MKRIWILAVAGVLLALGAVALVVELTSTTPADNEEVALEPGSPERSSDSLAAPPSYPRVDPTVDRVDGEEGAAPRAAVSTAAEERFGEIFVEGTVLSPFGAGFIKARMTLSTDEELGSLAVPTDEQGRYRLGPVTPGVRRLTVRANGLYPQHVDLELTGEKSVVQHDFKLVRLQRISVRLATSRGEPAVLVIAEAGLDRQRLGLVPVATREDPGDTYPVRSGRAPQYGIGAFTEQLGAVGTPRGPTHFGFLTLRQPAPAWVSLVAGQQVLSKKHIDRSVDELTFVVDPEDLLAVVCEVSATLIAEEDGRPLAGEAWIAEDRFPEHSPVAAGPDGFVRFEQVSPANVWLVAKAPGRAEVQYPVALTPGERLDFGDVPLPPPVQLRGRVTRSTGEPARVMLRWGRLDPVTAEVEWELRYHVRSRSDGRFSIPNLAPGIYAITSPRFPDESTAPPEDWVAPPQRVDVTQGTVEGVEVLLQRTSLITLAFPENVQETLHIHVQGESGITVVHTLIHWEQLCEVRLVPGTYELVLSRNDEVVHRTPLYVGSGPERIEVRF